MSQHCNHAPDRFTYGSPFPDHVAGIKGREWMKRVESDESLLILDGSHYFVRANLAISIQDSDLSMSWGIWFSISEDSYKAMTETWDTPGREKTTRSFFSWVCNSLPAYPETNEVMAMLHTEPVGRIPHAVLNHEEQSHPLVVDFHHGITMDRALEIEALINQGRRQ